MRPALGLLVLALLLAPSPIVSASEPIVPPFGTVWTVYNTVTADVRDNYATVKVVADIGNRGPDPEFPFVVRIPDDAFVTGLTIERDGTVYEAVVKEREQAREEYEAWRTQQQTGGLVEKARHTSVYSYLVNVAEFTSVRATLTYERYLAADRGVYNLSLEAPVSGFGEDLGARFEVTVRDSTGPVALWGDEGGRIENGRLLHEVGPRPSTEHPTPFTASYVLEATDGAGSLLTTVVDGVGYFAHRFRAQDDAEQLPMDLVLVLDVSGSMAGLKLDQMIDAAKQVVALLDAEDRLHLVAFSSDSRSTWSGLLPMTPDARRRAVDELEALFDGGGTNIGSGVSRGFAALDGVQRICDASASSAEACGIDWAEAGRFPALVLLTDGQPTAGVTGHDALRQLARDANVHDVPVFGIAFGDDADWRLVRDLADDGVGAAIRVPLGAGAEVDLRRSMSALTTPVLRDVVLDYNDGVQAHRSGAPVLFAGSELLVVGTFDPARGISGTVSGWTHDGERRYTFAGGEASTSLSFLPRLVAYHRVRELQQDDTPDAAAIKELALRYSFVTDHTSLVVTLPERNVREAQPETTQDADGRRASNATLVPQSSTTPSGSPDVLMGKSTPPGASDPYASRWRVSGDPSSKAYPYDAGGGGATPHVEAEPPAALVPGPGIALLLVALFALALARRK